MAAQGRALLQRVSALEEREEEAEEAEEAEDVLA